MPAGAGVSPRANKNNATVNGTGNGANRAPVGRLAVQADTRRLDHSVTGRRDPWATPAEMIGASGNDP
jgi:hypothetical protein